MSRIRASFTTPRPSRRSIGVALAIVVAYAAALVVPLAGVVALVAVILAAMVAVSPRDSTTVVVIGVVALFLIPARYVLPSMGAAGTPAVLIGVAALVWWTNALIHPNGGMSRGIQPVRIAVIAMMTTMLLTYATGWMRALTGLEGRNADRTLIVWAGFTGMLLLTADGISTRARLDDLLRWLVYGTTFMAAVGMTTFLTGFDLAPLLAPPGLESNVLEFSSTFARSSFSRVGGTALHPIEFAVVSAAVLPLALHYAFTDVRRSLLLRWGPVAVIGLAIPMAVSRSGVLGLAVALAFLWPSLGGDHRFRLGVAIGTGVALLMTVTPGLLGTIVSYFQHTSDDPSIQSRTDDIGSVIAYFRMSPLVGRGFGTFTPVEYDFLDNQYFMTLVESGLIGLVAMVGFLLTGIATAGAARRLATDDATRRLAQAIAASIAVHAVTFATYDALVFRISGMSLFVVTGAAGALWRLTRRHHPDMAPPDRARSSRPLAEIGATA